MLTVKPPYDAKVVWALLRSPAIRAELLLCTTGANRTRVRWDNIKNIAFPYPDVETAARFVRHIEAAGRARSAAQTEQETAVTVLNAALSLDEDQAHLILDAFKPPA